MTFRGHQLRSVETTGGPLCGLLSARPSARPGLPCMTATQKASAFPSREVFLKDVFMDSDTDVMVLSFVPCARDAEPVTIQAADQVRRLVDKLEGTHRLLLHGRVNPASPGTSRAWRAARDVAHQRLEDLYAVRPKRQGLLPSRRRRHSIHRKGARSGRQDHLHPQGGCLSDHARTSTANAATSASSHRARLGRAEARGLSREARSALQDIWAEDAARVPQGLRSRWLSRRAAEEWALSRRRGDTAAGVR